MQKYLPKHSADKSIVLPSLLTKKRKNYWQNKPSTWPDIRKSASDGHIYLLCDTRYPIGFVASATGGYSVRIDGINYGNYNSEEQFSMSDWSTYSTTNGYVIDYPTGATKAHIIDIYPQTENENITAFHCARVATSGAEEQGLLWAHFNISNAINLTSLLYTDSKYNNKKCMAITAKNNVLKVSGIRVMCKYALVLEYLPEINYGGLTFNSNTSFSFINNSKKITLKNGIASLAVEMFLKNYALEQIKGDIVITAGANTFTDCRALKAFPNLDFTNSTNLNDFATNMPALQDTVLDTRAGTKITKLGCYGTSTYFMSGLKGLRISNEAPFDNATAPQINVSYTGLDRQALVQLFNDLPTVSDGQIIHIAGTTGASDLTEYEALIPDTKGWTLTR